MMMRLTIAVTAMKKPETITCRQEWMRFTRPAVDVMRITAQDRSNAAHAMCYKSGILTTLTCVSRDNRFIETRT
jgi:hypothetical protein